MDSIQQIREDTYMDFKNKLDAHRRCCLIRPTGFGKTWLLTKLLREYTSVLYVYPAEVIKNTVVSRYYEDEENATDPETYETMVAAGEICNVTLMTYAKLALMPEAELSSFNYDIVVFDECHRLGGPRTRIAVDKLIQTCPNVILAGATATPTRGDGFDVVASYFGNITTFPYTLHDAFEAGYLQRPYYCYCTYDIETDLKQEALMAGEDINNITVRQVLSKKLIEISSIVNMTSIIRSTCEECISNTSYLKFIVFFSSISQLKKQADQVIDWFHKAYPEHTVHTLTISSESAETEANVNRLDELIRRPQGLDLIFCVDMINMGYHVNDLSGIVMYRGTSSDIIYIQQLGRALSSGASNSCVIFDVVDNLHRKGVFDLKLPYQRRKTFRTGYHVLSTGQVVNEDGQPGPLVYKDGIIYDVVGNKTDLSVNDSNEIVDTNRSRWYAEATKIDEQDLYATSHMATYRELIAKAVAEPMAVRCRQAIEAHFEAWCKANGVPYPISKADAMALYGLDTAEFNKQFAKIVNNNNIDYPMNDARRLLEIGRQHGQAGTPLSIFAKWKNVSIPAILNLLGVA